MAHYALLDENNIVVEVITGRDEDEVVDGISDWEAFYSQETGFRCLRTSISMFAGKHRAGKEPFRYNYAIIGGCYDPNMDAFIEPEPASNSGRRWILKPETCQWELEQPYPQDGFGYVWDPVVETWNRKGPPVPIPDLSKDWCFDDATQEWVEDNVEIVF